MIKLPDWSSVKHNPDARMEYHKQGFDISLEQLENLTREMQKDAAKCTTNAVSLVRLIADSMVKCFNQLYYDVVQGFPGYDAVWIKRNSDKKQLTLTAEEYETIQNMVSFSTWHAADGMSPAMTYDIDTVNTSEEYHLLYIKQMDKVMDVRIKLDLDPVGDYRTIIHGQYLDSIEVPKPNESVYWHEEDNLRDASQNMPCDNYGMAACTDSCPKYPHCHGFDVTVDNNK